MPYGLSVKLQPVDIDEIQHHWDLFGKWYVSTH
jgi:hypothetical protein